MKQENSQATSGENDIAIVGMAAHLPGAGSVAAFWDNLKGGISSIRRLSDEELLEAGENPALIARKDYVPFAAPLDGFETFDAEFFGFSPKEAAIMDPQHRQFLEVAWEALENAGHPPENFQGPIGVYAGCGMGSYFYFNLCSNPDLVDNVGMFLLRHTGNDKDFLSTRLSHVLDLKGPSLSIQTACSTSLVAVHYAAQSLLNGECDMALAGGVTLEIPQRRGYLYKEGEVLSPDGECHAFDHRAQGTVFGSGAGVLVLRRLADAIEDNDHIWAIIKGSAVNNDGAAKAGYLAPSVDGQAAAISEALAVADVPADSIDYIECHGTGTYLGDPIEVAALSEAFRETTNATGFCRIGSVKTNIGHLDTAAGVASLIKATMALKNQQFPPSLGYEEPNPAIDFEHSPFRVNDRLADWTLRNGPRRAGVNSLGVGGTNAHVVLQEAPPRPASDEADWPFQLLTISARSKAALDGNAQALAAHLRDNPDQPLADVAWTLKNGRRAFEKRRVVVADSHEAAARLLEANDPRRVFSHSLIDDRPDIAFMFPGGGAQYAGMARDLYETEPVFAEWMDKGLDVLQPKLDYDIRALWLPKPGAEDAANARLKTPSVQLPLIMIVEYALAQLWISWGITPGALVGHSMGENTAACLAGVISFEDCIGLVHLRGQLFDTVPAGGMLSVTLPAQDLEPMLDGKLDIAAVNAPGLSVATGPDDRLDDLQKRLEADDIDCQRIPIDIAAHSRMLEPILDRFRAYLRSIPLNPPQIPFVSNRSGDFITDAEATDPDYWVGHLRNTVNFADCIGRLAENPERVLLEVGPGKALSSLAQSHPAVAPNQVIGSLRHPDDPVADDQYFMTALGRLWAVGVQIDWHQIWGDARRQRVPLPSYAFQRAPYYIAPGEARATSRSTRPMRIEDPADWGYQPLWRPVYPDTAIDVETDLVAAGAQNWLLFLDQAGIGAVVADRLRKAGKTVVTVRAGDAFARDGADGYVIAPERGREAYDQLLQDLMAHGRAPDRIAHFWLLTQAESFRPGSSFFHRNQEQGFFSLMFLAQAISDENLPRPLHISVITSGAAQVRGEALPYPEKAMAAGPVRVIPRELPGVSCAMLDVALPDTGKRRDAGGLHTLASHILEDLVATPANLVAALRGDKRYELSYGPRALSDADDAITIRDGGTYLITGGFGGIGLTIAADLIRENNARIVLLSRSALPPRSEWPGYRGTGAVARRIRAVEALEAIGGAVMVATADVCNVEEMAEALARIDARFGPVNGVIHAAGVIDDGPLLTKNVSSVEDVFTPKIHGTQVLDQLFPDGALDWLVLFSSTSTATAPAGQIDYVAANEYLNAYAKSRAGGRTRVVAINWGIWSEVGMAADAVAERDHGHGDSHSEAVGEPLLADALLDGHSDRVFTGRLSADDWVIGEHRLADGQALLPGTGYLELAAEALRAQGEPAAFEINDLYFLRPLDVGDDSHRDIRVRLQRSDEGYALDIRSDCNLDGRAGYVLNAQAQLGLSGIAQTAPLDLDAIRARCPDVAQADAAATLTAPQESHLKFGSRWRVLQRTAFGDGEGIADLRRPDDGGADDGFILHPALMDIATGWAMKLIDGYHGDHLWVPVSYSAVRVYRALPADIVSWVRNAADNRADAPYASFDITLCDPDGTVCVDIKGFSIRKIDTGSGFDFTTVPSLREVEFPTAPQDADRPLSPAEERLRQNLAQGIRPDEGARAFRQALAAGQPQVIVSSLDLEALIQQASAEAEAGSTEGQKFERPQMDQDYVAPDNDIERTLAGFWEDLLGVTNIGVEDSFFDLGGHSLIAVRLFGMVKKAYRVDFPISILFEAPSIRKIADRIAERVGPVADDAGGETAAEVQKPKRRFTHLVPMHDGEGGRRTPFFLVAGMFGNVLNLRHVAHLVGADRPFYGLQARGLFGDQAPHRQIPEAAADYIAEMRVVQPHGPYMLGGFSGGGITAFEIARQLQAAGEKVALLVMLDTPLPQRRPLTRRDRLLIQWHELKRKGVGYLGQWVANRIRWELSKRRATPDGADTSAHQFHNAEIEAAFLEAVSAYQVQKWTGNLVLFRPPLLGHWQVSGGQWVDSQRAYVFADNDWTQFVPGIRVFEVPGDHDSMVLEPNVRVLAGRLKRCLDEAETPGGKDLKLPDGQHRQAAE